MNTICLPVIPVAIIKPLSEQLNWRLSPVLLLLGHIKIINEQNTLLADRGTEQSFPPLVQFGENYVLCLIGRSLGRKTDEVRHEPEGIRRFTKLIIY